MQSAPCSSTRRQRLPCRRSPASTCPISSSTRQCSGWRCTSLRSTRLLVRYAIPDALEHVRTRVMQQVPGGYAATRQSTYEGFSSDARRLYRVLPMATAGVFGVVALGLIVALATGLLECRRPFALLRAAGTPLRTLRRTMFLEAGAALTGDGRPLLRYWAHSSAAGP